MVGEVLASFSLFKSMMDTVKGLKDINDAAVRNTVAIELQEKILAAQEAQSALVQQVRDLEKEVVSLKEWDAEKQKYELTEVSSGAFAYMLKPEACGSEPPHWLCTTCYENHKKSFMQGMGRTKKNDEKIFYCPRCKAEVRTHWRISPGKEAGKNN